MSLLIQYRSAEAEIKRLQDRLLSLKQNAQLQRELEFEGKLLELMNEYGKSPADIVDLLDNGGKTAKARTPAKAEAPVKRTRKAKQYHNPHTNETIETKGGNHKTLKEWKATWGNDTVESWAIVLD